MRTANTESNQVDGPLTADPRQAVLLCTCVQEWELFHFDTEDFFLCSQPFQNVVEIFFLKLKTVRNVNESLQD